MVIAALVLAILFIVGGFASMWFTEGWDDMIGYVLCILPGFAGLALALVALAVHLIPAATAWSWLPQDMAAKPCPGDDAGPITFD